MASHQVYLPKAKDCKVAGFYEGSWQNDKLTSSFRASRQKPSRSSDLFRAHPIFAPVAWVACLLGGAAFWVAVFRTVF